MNYRIKNDSKFMILAEQTDPETNEVSQRIMSFSVNFTKYSSTKVYSQKIHYDRIITFNICKEDDQILIICDREGISRNETILKIFDTNK